MKSGRTSTLLLVAIFIMLLATIFTIFNSSGYFTLTPTTTTSKQSTASLDTAKYVGGFAGAIKNSNNPKDILTALSKSNLQTSYSKKVDQMTKNDLYNQILRMYDFTGKTYTQQDLVKLKSRIDSTDDKIAKSAALMLYAANDANDLNKLALSKLSKDDKNTLNEITKNMMSSTKGKYTLTTTEQFKVDQIALKIDTQKQYQGALFAMDASAQIKNFLSGTRTTSSTGLLGIGADCASGDVVFSDINCFIVIGGSDPTYFGSLPYITIDVGDSNDVYNGSGSISLAATTYYDPNAPTSPFLNSSVFVNANYFPGSYMVDFGGSDQYYCPNMCQAVGYESISLLIDYNGNDYYQCGNVHYYGDQNQYSYYTGMCDGIGIDGLGMLIDYNGDDNYDGGTTYDQGFGNGGTGLVVDYNGNDNYVGGSQGQVSSGNGMIIDFRGNDNYVCSTIACQGFSSSLGLSGGAIIDFSGSDSYSCVLECQAFSLPLATCLPQDIASSELNNQGCSCFDHSCVKQEVSKGVILDLSGPNTFHSCENVAHFCDNGCSYYLLIGSDGYYHFYSSDDPTLYENSCRTGIFVDGTQFDTRKDPVISALFGALNPFTTPDIGGRANTSQFPQIPVSNNSTSGPNATTPTVNPKVFIDTFDWCSGSCSLEGSNGAQSQIQYAYYNLDTDPSHWFITSSSAFSGKSARSGTIFNNQQSRLVWKFTLPSAPQGFAYSLSYNYRVGSEAGDTFTMYLTKINDLFLKGFQCFVQTGDGNQNGGSWLTFDSTNNPANPCSIMQPGFYEIDFVYSKDATGSTQPDAALIDNLQINLVPVGV